MLAAVLAGRLVMQDRALQLAVGQLQPGDRTVQVVWSGAATTFSQLDPQVTPKVRALTGEQPVAAMLFREASIQGRLVNVRAADDLNRWVKLVSGRLPTRCVPAHCEVLRLKGRGPIPSTSHLNLIEVGRATLKPDAPFAAFVLPTPPTEQVARAVRYHTPQPSPTVIANGVAGLSRTPELETFYRAYGWFLPVGHGEVHPWAIDDVRAKGAAPDRDARGRFRPVPGHGAERHALDRRGVVTRRCTAAASARGRGRCAPDRVHRARGRGAAARRDGRSPPPDVVRRTALAGGALHARRVDRGRRRGDRRRLDARWGSRSRDRVASRLARRGGRQACAPDGRRPRRCRCRRGRRRPPPLRNGPRTRRATRPPGVDTARHGCARCDRRRAGRLGARLRRRAAARRAVAGRTRFCCSCPR